MSASDGWIGVVEVGSAFIRVEVAGRPPQIVVTTETPVPPDDEEAFASCVRLLVTTRRDHSAIDLDGEQAAELIRLLAEAAEVHAARVEAPG